MTHQTHQTLEPIFSFPRNKQSQQNRKLNNLRKGKLKATKWRKEHIGTLEATLRKAKGNNAETKKMQSQPHQSSMTSSLLHAPYERQIPNRGTFKNQNFST
jgi:hypothetical protein